MTMSIKKEKEIVKYITEYYQKTKFYPNFREISKAVNLCLDEIIHHYMRILEDKGVIICKVYFPEQYRLNDTIINNQTKDNDWIPCSERMPEEHDSIFKKFKGTDKWKSAMFEKMSNDVNVTIEFKDGTRSTTTAHTVDGKWSVDRFVEHEVIAWQPLPEPYRP